MPDLTRLVADHAAAFLTAGETAAIERDKVGIVPVAATRTRLGFHAMCGGPIQHSLRGRAGGFPEIVLAASTAHPTRLLGGA